MKVIKYIACILALSLMFSCKKHEIMYNTKDVDTNMAEFQLHYFEPVYNVAANYIDSVFVNDLLYSSVNGSGQLLPYNGVPGGDVGRFFAVNAGAVNFKFYRKGDVIYNETVTLNAGKQNVFVHNLSQAPVVIDNQYPYNDLTHATGTAATWDTDSIATVKFCNFLYEDAATPYKGKIQCQYKDVRTNKWTNLGNPVGFGEATDRITIKVVKSVFNSSGYCKVNFRLLDESGRALEVMDNSGHIASIGYIIDVHIGRAYMYILCGIRTAKPVSSIKVWTSL